jgi:hypothetical protein
MFLLDSLLIDGLGFVLDKLRAVADEELRDGKVLREQLLDAQMRLELGELTPEEFARIEREVFDRLREIRGAGPAPLSMTSAGAKVSVEATVADDVK